MPRTKSQNPVLVTAPRLRFTSLKRGAAVRISNDELGFELDAPAAHLEILKFFRKPRKVSDLKQGLADNVLRTLTERSMLISPEQRDLFRHGSIRFSDEAPIGRAMTVGEAVEGKRGSRFAILGAGDDTGARGEGGARHGPSAIRRSCPVRFSTPGPRGLPDLKKKLPTVYDLEFHRRIDLGALEVRDLGDVHHVTGESNADFGQRVAWFSQLAWDRGYCLLGLGGDHSLSRFFMRPLVASGQDFGVIHFDAHTDLYDVPRDVFTHGNPFDEVLASTGLRTFLQVGTRQLRTDRGALMKDDRLFAVSARDVSRSTPEALFAALDTALPYYVTFDVDCMSPTECPETGTPVPGGLTYYQALDLFDWLGRSLNIIGADFMEVTGPVSPRNQAAQVTANLLTRLMLSRGTASPLGGQLFRSSGSDPFALQQG